MGDLSVASLCVGFALDQPRLLNDFGFEIKSGRFIAIVGPSGCGKTTLLRCLAGLQPRISGEIAWNATPLPNIAAISGYVFQEPSLLPWRSVAQNVAYGLELRNISRAEVEVRVSSLLSLTGLSNVGHLRPHQLSGGMQQRVNLARALAIRPQVLLLDEPFSALDNLLRERLQDELQQLWLLNKLTALMVTHQLDEAVWLSDEVWVMTGRPAQISFCMPVTLERPRMRNEETMQQVARLVQVLRTSLQGAA